MFHSIYVPILHHLWEIARYWLKIAVLTYPTFIWRPRWGWPRWNFAEIFGIRKLECSFVWYKNIACRFFGLVTKHACGRQTDRQNYDSQDRASIAVSRGKNCIEICWFLTKLQAETNWLLFMAHSVVIVASLRLLVSVKELSWKQDIFSGKAAGVDSNTVTLKQRVLKHFLHHSLKFV